MITVNTMIRLLKEKELLKEVVFQNKWFYNAPHELSENEITHITYDSRDIQANSLFFCKGLAFKEEYLCQAMNNGASYYVTETYYDVDFPDALGLVVTDVKKAMALISMAFYKYPQNQLKIIAYTGTKGKTTAAYFCKTILEKATDHKVALLSTMETILDGKTAIKSKLTTPESVDLYRMMAEAVANGMSHLVMEVSSQAYKTERVYELYYDVGVFLNISPDHIGSVEHPDFDDYFYCKRELLKHSKTLLLNKDADYFDLIKETAETYCDTVYTYSQEQTKNADYTFISQPHNRFEVVSQLDPFDLNQTYQIQLSGDFNQGNALSAMITTKLVGADNQSIREGVQSTRVPGRMEKFTNTKGAFIYIDYAHNYLSLHSLLAFVREEHKTGDLYVILGSTGGKGVSRRVDFSKVLSEFADEVIFTTDDPGNEDPATIIQVMKDHLTKQLSTVTILDRKEAIKHAFEVAKEGDSIVIAGKGADEYQLINGERVPYEGDIIITEKLIGSGY